MHGHGDIAPKPTTEADFEDLAVLRIDAMRESLETIGRFDPVRARERLRAGFTPKFARYIIADGDRVGFVVVKPSEGDLLLDHLYISPPYQGRGIGSIVLSKVIEEAAAACKAIRVGALRGSRSNVFYLRHGFVQTGEAEWDIYYMRASDGSQ